MRGNDDGDDDKESGRAGPYDATLDASAWIPSSGRLGLDAAPLEQELKRICPLAALTPTASALLHSPLVTAASLLLAACLPRPLSTPPSFHRLSL